jgi:tetratricopeptide (TPR) repeat protein
MTEDEKKSYISSSEIKDIDQRERFLQSLSCYRHMREKLYPHLRTVRFDFHLHRKGMVKDTVHTTVLDSTYMNGVQAIRDRDYEVALTLLRPYNDYNTAIAYLCMDYNASAMQILESLERTAQVNYMLAVLYSRRGDEEKAVECYVRSCSQDPTYVHRGNLDPEISVLIRRYGLNAQPEDEFEYSL